MFTKCDTEFNMDTHLVDMLQDAPFFAELSRHIHKCPTTDLPTAAVAYDEKLDEIVMYWNPNFFASLSKTEVRGVLTHEFYHLVFNHLASRRKKPAKLWNVATDLAINSLILDAVKGPSSKRTSEDRPLPEFALVPGVFPKHPEGREFTDEEKASMKLAAIIEKLPPMMASEWYFNKINEESEKDKAEGGSGLEGELGSMDDHDAWDSLPEKVREYVEGKIKSIVDKAVKKADSKANGWGNVPTNIADAIRRSVSNVINWRNVLRQFVGQLVRGGRTSSIKRINKRYPYIHPGTKRSYEAKLLIAIDQSGSVDDGMLAEFFAELGSLTKKVTVDILPFDCEAREADIFTWRKGARPELKRIRAGGTDFNAPTNVVNDPKNRGRWDGFLCLTDGEAPAPKPSRVKRGWVLGKGRKLMFGTTELTISMNDGVPVAGAWR